MPQVVVYGAGGMGAEVAEMILDDRQAGWELLGFVDDSPSPAGTKVLGLPIVGTSEWLSGHSGVRVALGIGHPRSRYRVAERVEALGVSWATIVHPSCTVLPSAEVGEGCVIFAGCRISSRAKLGRLSYLNYQAVVSHDASVGDFACVMAHAALSGGVTVGEGAFVGVGVSTRQGVAIGEWSIVGAGATVVRDLPPFCVATGIPARVARRYAGRDDMPPF